MSWIEDLIEKVGIEIVEEILRLGVDRVLHPDTEIVVPKSIDVTALLAGAARVREILPERLPTDDESAKIDAEIKRARAHDSRAAATVAKWTAKVDRESDVLSTGTLKGTVEREPDPVD